MKVLIVDTYYPQFLKGFWAAHPELAEKCYQERHDALMAAHFAEADSYSYHLRQLDYEATEIIANAGFLQQQWALEHGLRVRSTQEILAEQIRLNRPDVLYLQNISLLDDAQLRSLKEHVRLTVGQIASPLPPNRNFSGLDLIISSFPHFVRFFRNIGISSEYLRLGFDPRVLVTLRTTNTHPTVPIVFIGGLSRVHHEGTLLLESVARKLPVKIWGYGAETLPTNSPLRRVHQGPAWGLDMYRILASTKIALNRHIDVAGRYANNLRLYEATGVGTCLITDARDNLAELFEPDREVVTYRSPEECVEKCRYLIEHESERAAIALAGQKRTLSEHTWAHRMLELDEILKHYLSNTKSLKTKTAFSLPTSTRHVSSNARLRAFVRELPGQRFLRALYHRLPKRNVSNDEISYGHRVIGASDVTPALIRGWQNPSIAPKQRQLVDTQLAQMYQGDVALVFRVAAEAVRSTGITDGTLVEIGCASGYYYEVLEHLLRCKINYIGLDYSYTLIEMARGHYRDVPFLMGDATRLPLSTNGCDILFSGTVLLHVPDYKAVIRESARVARHYCIFHRTPVVQGRETSYFSKYAYGTEVVELVFGENELHQLFQQFGLKIERTIPIDTYSLKGIDGKVMMITYVCRKSNNGRF